jgi:hypothetical protein
MTLKGKRRILSHGSEVANSEMRQPQIGVFSIDIVM